jgi:hypothetical protein
LRVVVVSPLKRAVRIADVFRAAEVAEPDQVVESGAPTYFESATAAGSRRPISIAV